MMDTRNWTAQRVGAPHSRSLRLVGEVYAANPGVQAKLQASALQGSREDQRLLELDLIQQAGIWPQVMTWVEAEYEELLSEGQTSFAEIEVVHAGVSIATVAVREES